jgi:aspartyl-tRNA(Asn)/glutamyl-tRNA(Gln) amidotransferase subunit C
MAFSRDDVNAIARLGRLNLTEEELVRFGSQLGAILGYVELLDKVDLKGVEPTTHVQDDADRFREDRVLAGLTAADLEAMAPEFRAGSVRVPKILED